MAFFSSNISFQLTKQAFCVTLWLTVNVFDCVALINLSTIHRVITLHRAIYRDMLYVSEFPLYDYKQWQTIMFRGVFFSSFILFLIYLNCIDFAFHDVYIVFVVNLKKKYKKIVVALSTSILTLILNRNG